MSPAEAEFLAATFAQEWLWRTPPPKDAPQFLQQKWRNAIQASLRRTRAAHERLDAEVKGRYPGLPGWLIENPGPATTEAQEPSRVPPVPGV